MRPRIAYVTNPDTAFSDPDAALLCEALEHARMDVHVQPWDSDAAWEDFDAVLIGCSWGPTARRQEFLRWARTVDDGTLLANPLRALVRSTDRTHLRDLERYGIACAPMLWFEPGDSAGTVAEQLAGTDWARFLVQPNVITADARAAGADSAAAAAEAVLDLLEAGCNVSVESLPVPGEHPDQTSVVVIGGRPDYALSMALGPGADSGDVQLAELDESLAQVAARVVAAESGDELPAYARVDCVRGEGEWLVRAFDACGPELHLAARAGAAEELAWAVRGKIIPDERRSGSRAR